MVYGVLVVPVNAFIITSAATVGALRYR